MSEHRYDSIGICMKCDECDVAECCEQTEECSNWKWAFLSNGSIERFVAEIKKKRGIA